ncbi:sigma-70 family RNA polymerase sigma factor [Nostoc sp. UIC 10630]|uniref:sigma-70 family RNA polymerase sigma factor n=1 Tax=Nostoc sp. UIC 10630 TaxID=2100146 RepID=UPI0013D25009|nr:sigma-70 family RNA polymerase sigma factor [Nostoc sp. UIC 10630]NEU77643.1 sigma-70 family RNA polymerase sigma factor [Nostoc sp. UIC 10630]
MCQSKTTIVERVITLARLDQLFPALKELELYTKLALSFTFYLRKYNLLGQYQPEEIISEAICRLYQAQKQNKLIPNNKVKAWLRETGFRHIKELALERKKWNSVIKSVIYYTLPFKEDNKLNLEYEENTTKVHEILQQMNPDDSQLLIWRELEHRSWEYIASQLANSGEIVTVATLRKRGQRAKDAFRKIWRKKML